LQRKPCGSSIYRRDNNRPSSSPITAVTWATPIQKPTGPASSDFSKRKSPAFKLF
jgi:hypothetical protein